MSVPAAVVALPHGRVPPHNLDAEKSLLGGILLDSQAFSEVVEIVRGEEFYRDAHRKVFEAMSALFARSQPIDRITVKDELTAMGAFEAVGGDEFIDLLDKIVPTAANLAYYAKIVHEKALARRLIEAASAIAQLGYEQHGDVGEFADECERRIFAVTEQRTSVSFVHVKPIIAATFKNIEALYERQEEITGIPTGFADLDRMTSGFQPGDLVILAARPSMGKAQPLDAPVLTPEGYRPMGDIRAGSFVIGADGKPHRVLAVFPQGYKPVFRLRFSDGGAAECCDEHLWRTTTREEGRAPAGEGSIKALSEIRRTLRDSDGGWNHRVPTVAPVEFAPRERPLLLAPYLMGLLLGDGTFPGVTARLEDADARERLSARLPEVESVSVDGITARVRRRGEEPGRNLHALRYYGLHGLSGREKFIPDDYLHASIAERLDLLRGLLDTDGEVVLQGGRAVEFRTSFSRLAEGVASLARSLGGVVTRADCEAAVRLRICFPNGIVAVSSRRHLDLWESGADGFDARFIEAVEPAGVRPCQCILVDSDDHLYVTSDFVVTHNTAFCLNIATHVGCRAQYQNKRCGVGIFSLEMPKEQLVMRMLSSEARVDSQRIRTGKLIESDWAKLAQAAGVLADANVHIDDTPAVSALELRAKCRRLFSRHENTEAPIRLIVVDYLQLMRGSERIDSREQQISEISRSLKALAKELGVPVLALSQLNRSLEKRPDKRPLMSDLRECVPGDTLVMLADGRRVPIRELVGKSEPVLAVREGKLTVTRSEPAWKVGIRDVFEVQLASGRSIRATEEHRLLAFGGWKTVGQLGVGDRLAIARSLPEPENPLRWPEERIILLAHMIGDGSYLPRQPIRYTTGSEENSAAVWNAAKRCFPDCTINRREGTGHWHQLEIGANGNRWHIGEVREWFSAMGIYGQRSHQKRIPEELFRLDNGQTALFLRHLWATDGTICNHKNGQVAIAFDTCSKELVWGVAALLLRFGIVARVRPSSGPLGRPWWHLTVTGVDAQRRFLSEIGAFGPRRTPAAEAEARLSRRLPNTNVDTVPQEVFSRVRALMTEQRITTRRMASMRGTSYGGNAHFAFAPSRAVVADYARLLHAPDLDALANSDLFWDRIVSITPAGTEEVFDLTVPGPSCWLADGIVSHNSGALEQDADTIVFIYREEVYEKEKEDVKGVAEISISKQRDGPIGDVNLAVSHEHTRFENLAREYIPGGE